MRGKGGRKRKRDDEMDGWGYTILTPRWKQQEEDGKWYIEDDDDDEMYQELSEESGDELWGEGGW